jgi:hypothetical protein
MSTSLHSVRVGATETNGPAEVALSAAADARSA